MAPITLTDVSKRFKDYNCRNRWLRKDLIDTALGKPKDYGWRTVLRDINIEINSGETVAIVGRNGSGKTTLLQLMAGIIQPTTGKIYRYGSTCTLFDVGAGFHDDLTGIENVFINGAILGLPQRYLQSMLSEVESFAELQGFMNTPIKFYSSGMRARLGFAVAMIADPDIFLIDEVLAVGDAGFRKRCYARLRTHVSRGRTIVMVSHDTYAIEQLCSRAIWIHDGAIRADGPAADVCREYVDHFDAPALVT